MEFWRYVLEADRRQDLSDLGHAAEWLYGEVLGDSYSDGGAVKRFRPWHESIGRFARRLPTENLGSRSNSSAAGEEQLTRWMRMKSGSVT